MNLSQPKINRHIQSYRDRDLRRVRLGAAQNDQCMKSKYRRECDNRADGSHPFEWLSRYFDVIH